MSFSEIITGAPLWVWIVLIYLISIGIRSMYNRSVYVPTLFLIPTALMVSKYQNIFSSFESIAVAILFLCIGSIVGIYFSIKTLITFKKEEFIVVIPGSYLMIVFLLTMFLIKFALGFFKATHSEFAQYCEIVDILMSALFSGYFLGRACLFTYKFYKQR